MWWASLQRWQLPGDAICSCNTSVVIKFYGRHYVIIHKVTARLDAYDLVWMKLNIRNLWSKSLNPSALFWSYCFQKQTNEIHIVPRKQRGDRLLRKKLTLSVSLSLNATVAFTDTKINSYIIQSNNNLLKCRPTLENDDCEKFITSGKLKNYCSQ